MTRKRTERGFGLTEIIWSALIFAFVFLTFTFSYLSAVQAWARSGGGFSSTIDKWNDVQEFRLNPSQGSAQLQIGEGIPPLRRAVLDDGFGRRWEVWSDAR
ncbi:MAG TPA: hypothetical protein VMN76_08280 [Acidobacteriota bacterium]|nr:hypothetical protein [Acidobacteriota bacterium]